MSTALSQAYRRLIFKRAAVLAALLVLSIASFIIDLSIGPVMLSGVEVLEAILGLETADTLNRVVILELRLPYALMALLVGASLGLAGAEMQTALNNPLASPFTLGIGAAATVGASLVIVFGAHWSGLSQTVLLPIAASFCAAAACALLLLVSRVLGTAVHTLVLFGIVLLFGLNALVGLIQFLADAEAVQQIVYWTLGSLARSSLDRAALLAVAFALCMFFAWRQAWPMTLLRSGEAQAASLGVAVGRLRVAVFIRVSVLTGVATAFVGEVGFIGLVGPHVARLLLGEDHRFFLPGSALAGALLLSLASVASRSLLPGVILPVGLVTALVGVPLFIVLITARGQRGQW